MAKAMTAGDRQWLRGYVMALADVARGGGQPSQCRELMRAAGVETEGEAADVAVEEYDLVEVRKILADGESLPDISDDERGKALATGVAHTLPRDALGTADAALVNVLTDAGLFKSRSEARRYVGQGGVFVNGAVAKDVRRTLGKHDLLDDGTIVLRKGLASYVVVRVAEEK